MRYVSVLIVALASLASGSAHGQASVTWSKVAGKM